MLKRLVQPRQRRVQARFPRVLWPRGRGGRGLRCAGPRPLPPCLVLAQHAVLDQRDAAPRRVATGPRAVVLEPVRAPVHPRAVRPEVALHAVVTIQRDAVGDDGVVTVDVPPQAVLAAEPARRLAVVQHERAVCRGLLVLGVQHAPQLIALRIGRLQQRHHVLWIGHVPPGQPRRAVHGHEQRGRARHTCEKQCGRRSRGGFCTEGGTIYGA